jgi:WD40 repeat protein
MPDVQELFRTTTTHVRPTPGGLDRQLRAQRRRAQRRKAETVALIALLALVAGAIVVRGLAERGRGVVPADRSTAPLYTVVNSGYGFSADGTRLFALGDAGYVYDAATGDPLDTVRGDRGNATIAFSPDGSLFVTVRGGRSTGLLDTYVFETASGRELWDFRKACCFVAFSPDGRFLALPRDGRTRVVDLATGTPVNEFDAFGRFVFSPDGRQLLIASGDPGVVAEIFDVFSRSSDPVLRLRGNNDGGAFSTQVAWSPDGATVVTATGDGKAIGWGALGGSKRFAIRSPAGRITSVAFGTSPTRLATGSSDGTGTVWDVSSSPARSVFSVRVGVDDGWLAVALSPDGSRLMTAAAGQNTSVWGIT